MSTDLGSGCAPTQELRRLLASLEPLIKQSSSLSARRTAPQKTETPPCPIHGSRLPSDSEVAQRFARA